MVKKFGLFDDIGEQLVELGKSTAKQSVKAVASIADPKLIFESVTGNKSNDKGMEQLEKGKGKKGNHTPLDFQKLEDKYKDQDKAKTESLRQRLFQMVKSSDEKLMMEKKQEVMQKKRQDTYQEQEKKKREQEQQNQRGGELPQGKVRRSIFSKKKVAQREQAEVKPSSGKQ